MPLVRHRDTLSDLIRKGGEHKSHLKNERIKQSELMIRNQTIMNESGAIIRSSEEIPTVLRASSLFLYLVELTFVKLTRFAAIVLAFTIVLAETSGQRGSQGLVDAVNILEYICDIYYLLDGGAKLLSMYAYVEIVHNHLYHKISRMAYARRSGLVDLGIAIASLVYMSDATTNRWLHLVRCAFISLFYLEQLPQIDVLSSGISAGLTSTLYTWLLMTVTFLVYAAAGVIFFKENDPYHFGDLAMAMWTYFEMSTLDNWADVMNINYWGCDDYTSDYYVNGTAADVIHTEFGSLHLPICYRPKASPTSASLFFVSFVLICGFILVSLTVAFVTTGINTRLHELQREEDMEELKAEAGSKKKIKFPTRKKITKKGGKKDEDAHSLSEEGHSAKLDGSNSSILERSNTPDKTVFTSKSTMHNQSSNNLNEVKDPELLRQLLKQVWKGDDNIIKSEDIVETHSKRPFAVQKSGSFFNKPMSPVKGASSSVWQKRMLKFGVKMRVLVSDVNYNYFIYVVIIFAAVLELLSIENLISKNVVDISSIVCQVVFSIDMMFKFASHAPRYKQFFYNSWNIFDLALVVLLWIPVFTSGDEFFELLKILRIIRVLKMLSFIEELNVIIKSISTSARCLAYVIFFMLVFFFHFGAAGVFLFSKNDPFHFEDIGRAMLSLFQVSTLDNWGDIARMNMYGCRYIGYDPKFCDLDQSKGYGWLAAWYFVIFVIVGVMVLVALFIGVIITSMELLHTSIHEEADMLKKVREKQAQFNINDATCNTLLEIFDMIDVCANGRLTLHELKPVLAMVSLGENQQYELFHKIDEDASGKIDFAEFVELIKLMGEAYSANNPTTPLKDNMTKIKILHKFGLKSKGIMPFGTPKVKGWGALTASAVTASALTTVKSGDELGGDTPGGSGAGSKESPTARAPSSKQASSFKRKSMLLTAARIESAKVAEEEALIEAKRAAEANAEVPHSDDPTPKLSTDTKDRSYSGESMLDGSKQPAETPPVSSAMASMLKKRSQKASSAVAEQKKVIELSPLEVPAISPKRANGVKPFSNTDSGALTPTRRQFPGSPKAQEKVKPVHQEVPSHAEEEKRHSPQMHDHIIASPSTLGDNIYANIGSFEGYNAEDVVTATLMRYPSDDSAVSNKYKSNRGNNTASSIEKMNLMRKYRSGPIDTSRKRFGDAKVGTDEDPVKKMEPNLFFDYKNDGSEDNLEAEVPVRPRSQHHRSKSPNRHRQHRDRPASRG